jgi:uncharacterized protein YjbI with pentapeptide repeats
LALQLSRADLSGSDLVFASFGGANLERSDLAGSCLTYADLAGADLSGANLTSADLHEADLSSANINGADLRGADVRNVFGMTPDQIQAVAITSAATKFGKIENRTEYVLCGPEASIGIVLHTP